MPRRPMFAGRTHAAPARAAAVEGAAVVVAAVVAAFLGLLPACFSPSFESGRLRCAAGDVCPDGFTCAQGRCWRPGDLPGTTDAGADSGGTGTPAKPPMVIQAATANPTLVTGTTTGLSVLGDDVLGENHLFYTWALVGPGLVGFSDNGTNTAKNTTAIFTTAGRHTFSVLIQNRDGLNVSSMVDVEVEQRVNDMALTPSMATVPLGGTQQFKATAFDQFGTALPDGGVPVRWLLQGGCGVVSEAGLFQAAPAGGTCLVTAISGNVTVAATVSVGTADPLLLVPVADAHVEDGNPDKNFGGERTLLVKTQDGTSNNRLAYLRFSLAALPAPVTGARLRLFGRSQTNTHGEAAFEVSDHTWAEGTITWRNKPALGTKLVSVGVTTAPKYHEWDVTALVQTLQRAGMTTLDLALQMESSTSDGPDSFESRESPTNKPQLVLTP